ncbi:hypothetical protein [Paenibacillus agilis]|uniref:Uncharacterized protein n=1 Tax=Paenibacillus agilis TaxID=3020863 RepID=A0A559IX13_9BACL|nr:hypothetical protein [Paenibacillus agilis]TVX92178.1 hypothetical protein FPZ44_03370 [Paenibacillus agilis]
MKLIDINFSEVIGSSISNHVKIVEERVEDDNCKALKLNFILDDMTLNISLFVEHFINNKIDIRSNLLYVIGEYSMTDEMVDEIFKYANEFVADLLKIIFSSELNVEEDTCLDSYANVNIKQYDKLKNSSAVGELNDQLPQLIKDSEEPYEADLDFRLVLYGTPGRHLANLLQSLQICDYTKNNTQYNLVFHDPEHEGNEDFLSALARKLIKLGFVCEKAFDYGE